MKVRRVEGFWICKHCDSKVRGGLKTCPNCGKAQDDGTNFDIDRNNIRYVSKEDTPDKPDWICNYCNQLNPDSIDSCRYCGADRTAENLDYFENRKKKEAAKKSFDDESDGNSYDIPLKETSSSYSQDSSDKKLFSIKDFFLSKMYAFIFAFVAILGTIGLIFLLMPEEKDITIQEFSWERSIVIEKLQPVQESDWELPYGARLLYTQEELYDTERVIDYYETVEVEVTKQRIIGYEDPEPVYEDLGNGYFNEIIGDPIPIYEDYIDIEEQEVPVYKYVDIYATKYYYEIDKWLYERTVTTSAKDHDPYFGEANLFSNEREDYRGETYTIIGLDENGKQQSINLSFEDWSSLEVGQTVKLKVSLGYGEIVE